MKIKKLNTALAIVIAAGGLFCLIGPKGAVERARSTTATQNAASGGAGSAFDETASSAGSSEILRHADFSAEGKEITVIPWQFLSDADKMPGQPVLKKWKVGSRGFYQLTGPVNPSYVGQAAKTWGSHLAFEVFFRRDGRYYDQWILGPPRGVVNHYRDWMVPVATSGMPSSRYRMEVQGSQVTVTFWCYANDTPANIVFNYNLPNQELAWCSTSKTPPHKTHHQRDTWTDP